MESDLSTSSILTDQQSDSRYNKLLDALNHSGQGLFVVDSDYRIRFMSQYIIDHFGDQTGKICYTSVADRQSPCSYCRLNEVIKNNKTVNYQAVVASGQTFEIIASPIKNDDGTTSKLEVIRDISSRKEVEKKLVQQQKYLQSVIDGINDPIMVISTDYTVQLMNKSARANSAMATPLNTDQPKCYELSHFRSEPCNDSTCPCPLLHVIDHKEHITVVHNHPDATGAMKQVEVSAAPLWDGDNKFIGVIETSRDITAHIETQNTLRDQQQVLHFQANYDGLTQLPNRTHFFKQLDKAISHSKSNGTSFALLYLDIDRFKQINDSLGHATGDKTIKIISKRLYDATEDQAFMARLGGDEFILLMEEANNKQAIVNLARTINELLREPVVINNQPLFLSGSIGISHYPQDGQTGSDLLKFADAAMYQAKNDGRDTFQFYTSGLSEQAFARVLMEANLRQALDDEQFTVYYQPQVDGHNGRIIGMEALVRWQHPELGLVSPGQFIPLAEETGLIVKLDQWVMQHAMQQIASWYRQGLNPGTLSVNLSMVLLHQESFVTDLQQSMDGAQFIPQWLELEISEGQVMKNPEQSISKLQQISDLGISLAIDDFGTGHSSLTYLKRLPADRLKIDQSFVRELPDNEEDAAITMAVIALSQSLKLKVIAEGVETAEQNKFLIANGCQDIQGYYFGRPMPAQQIEQRLREEMA